MMSSDKIDPCNGDDAGDAVVAADDDGDDDGGDNGDDDDDDEDDDDGDDDDDDDGGDDDDGDDVVLYSAVTPCYCSMLGALGRVHVWKDMAFHCPWGYVSVTEPSPSSRSWHAAYHTEP